MAKSETLKSTFFVPLALTLLFSSLVTASYYQSISPSQLGFVEEKLTHIRFYFHDVVTGPKPTMVIAAEPLKGKHKAPLPFGTLVVVEDPLTEGPEPDSKLIGKAQGFYTSVSHREDIDLELIMGMTFAFKEGKYNGSTLSVWGRNYIFDPVREMTIIGGTGAFRFARGFVRARTYEVDYLKGDAIVEYNVYAFHYLTSSSSHEAFNEGVEFMIDPLLGKI